MPGSILDLNNELLNCVAGHITVGDLGPFSEVCTRFASIARHDAVWKEMLKNHYGVTYKLPNESWQEMYQRKENDMQDNRICPHIGCVDQQVLAPYIQKYQQILQWLPKNHNCSTCGENKYETEGLCLYIWQGNVRSRCRDCAYKYHAMAPNRHGILLRMSVLQMYCFTCSRLLGELRGDPSEAYHVNQLLEILTQGSELGRQAMRRKNQCMRERLLYAEEADTAAVLKTRYYLVDRMWICSWFLRLCDGKIGVGPIMNEPLEAEDGKINPNARPRGTFCGGFSIVTPHLWHYLVETYGLAGKEFTSGTYWL